MRTHRLDRARRIAALVTVAGALVAASCASDELDDSLGAGACKDGKCAEGFDCVDSRCVPHGSNTGGSAGSDGDAGDDGPCAACSSDQCCEGQCVDTLTSSLHCGTCSAPCPGTTCVGGNCTNDCAPGFFDCDGNKANGCEASGGCG